MSLKILSNTNAVDYVLKKPYRLLLHVCNNRGAMSSGIAKEIRERIPSAYDAYITNIGLGCCTWDYNDKVVNMVAQDGYGYDGKKYINYGALVECLINVRKNLYFGTSTEIVIPYKMGSGRAGGDWETVIELVGWIFQDSNVTVCKLGD